MNVFPIKVKTNDVLGRYLVASRDLKQGELILKETPLFVGPQISGSIICFRCNSHCYGPDYTVCSECSVATVCGNECPAANHSSGECETIKKYSWTKNDFTENPQIVFPVRCLLLKEYNKDLWDKFIAMQTHLESRRDTPIWRSHKIFVEQVLEKLGFISEDDAKSELVQKVCGILDVNSFEIRPPQPSGYSFAQNECLRGVFLQAALMAHDCVPNTHLAVDDDFNMTVHASKPIAEGETIFYSYCNGLQGNQNRRIHLKEGKYFDCSCRRCTDPTELGTNMSSIKCPRCKTGLVSPKNSLCDVYSSPWCCNRCPMQQEGPMIKSTISECKRLINAIELSGPLRAHEAEAVLKKLSRTLSQNHYLILELKQHLVAIYNELDPDIRYTKRKIELCRDFLPVLRVIEPGISRLQAIALYELHAAELSLANKQYNDKEISTDQFLDRLTVCEELLKEAVKYLLYEPAKSPEGRLSQKAMMELRVLRNTMKEINRILSMGDAGEIAKKLISGTSKT